MSLIGRLQAPLAKWSYGLSDSVDASIGSNFNFSSYEYG